MNLSAQMTELLIAYLLATAGMSIALWISRADRRAWWRLPLYSVMALALGVIVWNALRRHVIPADWPRTHASVIYWTALAIYPVLGLSLGLLLGRLTRRPSKEEIMASLESRSPGPGQPGPRPPPKS